MTISSSAASAAEELVRERERVVRRLRSMALDTMPTDRVLATAQRLADLAAEAAEAGEPDASGRREVPGLASYAAGDQVTVLTDELLATAARLDADSGARLLGQGVAVLTELRRDLAGP
ncbi:MAG: hypothetical protein M3P23_10665 [Actinomycetota bacterium]|nr:hypothetical protein [Actinomycetota bacterium]